MRQAGSAVYPARQSLGEPVTRQLDGVAELLEGTQVEHGVGEVLDRLDARYYASGPLIEVGRGVFKVGYAFAAVGQPFAGAGLALAGLGHFKIQRAKALQAGNLLQRSPQARGAADVYPLERPRRQRVRFL